MCVCVGGVLFISHIYMKKNVLQRVFIFLLCIHEKQRDAPQEELGVVLRPVYFVNRILFGPHGISLSN